MGASRTRALLIQKQAARLRNSQSTTKIAAVTPLEAADNYSALNGALYRKYMPKQSGSWPFTAPAKGRYSPPTHGSTVTVTYDNDTSEPGTVVTFPEAIQILQKNPSYHEDEIDKFVQRGWIEEPGECYVRTQINTLKCVAMSQLKGAADTTIGEYTSTGSDSVDQNLGKWPPATESDRIDPATLPPNAPLLLTTRALTGPFTGNIVQRRTERLLQSVGGDVDVTTDAQRGLTRGSNLSKVNIFRYGVDATDLVGYHSFWWVPASGNKLASGNTTEHLFPPGITLDKAKSEATKQVKSYGIPANQLSHLLIEIDVCQTILEVEQCLTRAIVYGSKSTFKHIASEGDLYPQTREVVTAELQRLLPVGTNPQVQKFKISAAVNDGVHSVVKGHLNYQGLHKSSAKTSKYVPFQEEREFAVTFDSTGQAVNTIIRGLEVKVAGQGPFANMAPDREMSDPELSRALRQSLVAEQDAIQLYESQADVTSRPEAAELLRDISREEKVHVGELEELISTVDSEEDKAFTEGREEASSKGASEGAWTTYGDIPIGTLIIQTIGGEGMSGRDLMLRETVNSHGGGKTTLVDDAGNITQVESSRTTSLDNFDVVTVGDGPTASSLETEGVPYGLVSVGSKVIDVDDPGAGVLTIVSQQSGQTIVRGEYSEFPVGSDELCIIREGGQTSKLASDDGPFDELFIKLEPTNWTTGEGLSQFEQYVHVIGRLVGQVQNGGFEQWLGNGYGESDQTVLNALSDVGTPTATRVAEMVGKALPYEETMTSSEGDEDEYEEAREALDKLDTEFYTIDDQLVADLDNWVLQHQTTKLADGVPPTTGQVTPEQQKAQVSGTTEPAPPQPTSPPPPGMMWVLTRDAANNYVWQPGVKQAGSTQAPQRFTGVDANTEPFREQHGGDSNPNLSTRRDRKKRDRGPVGLPEIPRSRQGHDDGMYQTVPRYVQQQDRGGLTMDAADHTASETIEYETWGDLPVGSRVSRPQTTYEVVEQTGTWTIIESLDERGGDPGEFAEQTAMKSAASFKNSEFGRWGVQLPKTSSAKFCTKCGLKLAKGKCPKCKTASVVPALAVYNATIGPIRALLSSAGISGCDLSQWVNPGFRDDPSITIVVITGDQEPTNDAGALLESHGLEVEILDEFDPSLDEQPYGEGWWREASDKTASITGQANNKTQILGTAGETPSATQAYKKPEPDNEKQKDKVRMPGTEGRKSGTGNKTTVRTNQKPGTGKITLNHPVPGEESKKANAFWVTDAVNRLIR